MGSMDYAKARKRAIREYHNQLQRRENPYLPVLAEIVPQINALNHISLGLVSVPLSKVVGTASKGRTNAFSSSFMPLLEPGSEFAQKWSILYDSVVENGLREPVKMLEYMNLFYLVEGNKRVSVMKFLDAVSIEAEVTRVIPTRSDDIQTQVYYEFMPFYNDTGINYLWFSHPGDFPKLCELTGHTPGKRWTSEERNDFEATYWRFRNAYKARSSGKTPITTGDAFLIYLKACGYDGAPKKLDREIRGEVNALWPEFEKKAQGENVTLIM